VRWAVRRQPVIAYLSSLLQRRRCVTNDVGRSLFQKHKNTKPLFFYSFLSLSVSTRQWSRLAIERAQKFKHNRSGKSRCIIDGPRGLRGPNGRDDDGEEETLSARRVNGSPTCNQFAFCDIIRICVVYPLSAQ
jgi:hypothetical protein